LAIIKTFGQKTGHHWFRTSSQRVLGEPANHPKPMQFLTVEDKRDIIDATSYFLSTLKTQSVRDEGRIEHFEKLLSKLQLDLSKYTL